MTRDDLAKILGRLGLTHDRARLSVDAFFDTLSDALREGRSVSIVGFGRWEWRTRKGRQTQDPRSGRPRVVPERRKVFFKASDRIKHRLNPGASRGSAR